MRVLDVGGHIFLLRFLGDSRRLFVGRRTADGSVAASVLSLSDGPRLDLSLPTLAYDAWYGTGCGPSVAVHPGGDSLYLAWQGKLLAFRTSDGQQLPTPPDVRASQIAISPDGDRFLMADLTWRQKQLYAMEARTDFRLLWKRPMGDRFANIAGFLPDGDRYLTIDFEDGVCVRTLADDRVLAAAKYPASTSYQPQLSADGRLLGIIGYASWYLYDMTDLGKPRRITANRSSGDYLSFAFHPNGKTMAMIHGGPTLVKIHDLETLELVRTYKWKLGALGAVAYSPDGTLGAAASQDGRVVVWDSEE